MAKVDLEKMRHSCSHLMAAAVMELYPKTRFGIGPAIEDGFYYDFDIPGGLSEEDLPKIEEKMRELAERNLRFEKAETKIGEALKIVKKLGQTYKVELIQDLKKEGLKKVTFYKLGNFVDLCEGPHVRNTKEIGPFKLLSVAGAYWRGSEENPMLTRIYGTCFASRSSLEKYVIQREEMKKRDHRRLGKELDLFTFSNLVGPGLPLWLPKGAIIRHEVENRLQEIQSKRGYQLVYSPHIAKEKMYQISRHLEFYKEKMYPPLELEKAIYFLKPMNCPHHMMIYKNRPRSYKELPLRFAEFGNVYRYEQPGELAGLLRVRGFTQDDAHIFCTESQLIPEFINVIELVIELLDSFGFKDYRFRMGTRDPQNLDKYAGKDEEWEFTQEQIRKAAKKKRLKFSESPGDAVFYGPKLDVLVKDAIGRDWQISTIQVDFNLPERFDITYIDNKGQKRTPFVLHRAPLGSMERFIAILTEHYGGAFPVWLSPVQVVVIPITDKHNKYAKQIYDTLINSSIRVELDDRSQTTSAKIRDAEIQRVPYMLVVGDKEVKAKNVNVRTRGEKVLGSMSLERFIKRIKEDIVKKRQV